LEGKLPTYKVGIARGNGPLKKVTSATLNGYGEIRLFLEKLNRWISECKSVGKKEKAGVS
jgi:hypothetical protein